MGTRTGVLAMTILLACGAAAAQGSTSHPGYFPSEEMGIFVQGDLEVDINLEGAMLQVAAGAMQEDGEADDSAAFVELVSGLDRVRVQVGSPSGADAAAIASSFEKAVSTLEAAGWNRILRVSEEDERVELFARDDGGRIAGLTLLVNDGGDEVVLVNILGDIDPVLLGRVLAEADHMPMLEELAASVN